MTLSIRSICNLITNTLPTLPDWTFTEETIPAPYGFYRLATPIELPVPVAQIPSRITGLAWFQGRAGFLSHRLPQPLREHTVYAVTAEAPAYGAVPGRAMADRSGR